MELAGDQPRWKAPWQEIRTDQEIYIEQLERRLASYKARGGKLPSTSGPQDGLDELDGAASDERAAYRTEEDTEGLRLLGNYYPDREQALLDARQPPETADESSDDDTHAMAEEDGDDQHQEQPSLSGKRHISFSSQVRISGGIKRPSRTRAAAKASRSSSMTGQPPKSSLQSIGMGHPGSILGRSSFSASSRMIASPLPSGLQPPPGATGPETLSRRSSLSASSAIVSRSSAGNSDISLPRSTSTRDLTSSPHSGSLAPSRSSSPCSSIYAPLRNASVFAPSPQRMRWLALSLASGVPSSLAQHASPYRRHLSGPEGDANYKKLLQEQHSRRGRRSSRLSTSVHPDGDAGQSRHGSWHHRLFRWRPWSASSEDDDGATKPLAPSTFGRSKRRGSSVGRSCSPLRSSYGALDGADGLSDVIPESESELSSSADDEVPRKTQADVVYGPAPSRYFTGRYWAHQANASTRLFKRAVCCCSLEDDDV
ncbi:uncharacterized protein L969DRAFT_18228 [Mixia osmundae IAM 14324]|nr:uncharacterized protein L969DRAFT_18228 [Mixia osmundae IAM 14324]KEI38204.1 hypothetical protein L969DRAFT_18228 [Mixia osmundae IAM 14324]